MDHQKGNAPAGGTSAHQQNVYSDTTAPGGHCIGDDLIQDTSVERLVLASITFMTAGQARRVCTQLSRECFAYPPYQTIYSALEAVSAELVDAGNGDQSCLLPLIRQRLYDCGEIKPIVDTAMMGFTGPSVEYVVYGQVDPYVDILNALRTRREAALLATRLDYAARHESPQRIGAIARELYEQLSPAVSVDGEVA